jgi:hypothetical protein
MFYLSVKMHRHMISDNLHFTGELMLTFVDPWQDRRGWVSIKRLMQGRKISGMGWKKKKTCTYISKGQTDGKTVEIWSMLIFFLFSSFFLSHTSTWACTCICACTHTHAHRRTLTRSLTHSLAHSLIHSHTHTLTHSHTHTHTLTLTLTHTHMRVHTEVFLLIRCISATQNGLNKN